MGRVRIRVGSRRMYQWDYVRQTIEEHGERQGRLQIS